MLEPTVIHFPWNLVLRRSRHRRQSRRSGPDKGRCGPRHGEGRRRWRACPRSARPQLNLWQVIAFANRHLPRVDPKPGPAPSRNHIAVDRLVHRNLGTGTDPVDPHSRSDSPPKFVVARICERVKRFKRPVITRLGLTCQVDVDDWRGSPAVAMTGKPAATETSGSARI